MGKGEKGNKTGGWCCSDQSVEKYCGDLDEDMEDFSVDTDEFEGQAPVVQDVRVHSHKADSYLTYWGPSNLRRYNEENGTSLTTNEVFVVPSRRGSNWFTDVVSRWFPASMVGATNEAFTRRSKNAHDAARGMLGNLLSEQEDVEYRTDGSVLRGKVYYPKEPSGKVLLFFPGNGDTFANFVRENLGILSSAGVVVVAMNYRGLGLEYEDEEGNLHNERSETLDEDGNVIETRRCEASICQDGEAMLDYVLKELKINGEHVKPENVVLRGFSMGGRVAAHVAENYERKELQNMMRTGHDPAMLGGLILGSPMDSLSDVAARYCKEKGIPCGRLIGSIASFFVGDYDTKASLENLRRFDPGVPVCYTGGGAKRLVDGESKERIEDRDFLSPLVTGIDEVAFENQLIDINTRNGHSPLLWGKSSVLLKQGRGMGRRQFVDGDELGEEDWSKLKRYASAHITDSAPSYDSEHYLVIQSSVASEFEFFGRMLVEPNALRGGQRRSDRLNGNTLSEPSPACPGFSSRNAELRSPGL